MMSGQPTKREAAVFFTVAAGFARSVSIAVGGGAAALAGLHRFVMMSGQPTNGETNGFFTVAAGLACSVPIAAGRGAAAPAASSARHDEWTTDRTGKRPVFTVGAGTDPRGGPAEAT